MLTYIIHIRKDTEERVKNLLMTFDYYRRISPSGTEFVFVEDDAEQHFKMLQEEKQQLTTQLYEVQAVLENNPTVTPFKLESDGSNN